MKPKEAYIILKKKLDDGHVVVGCKDFGSYYGFFISQKNNKIVGSNMMTVNKLTRNIGVINVMERTDQFLQAKNVDVSTLE